MNNKTCSLCFNKIEGKEYQVFDIFINEMFVSLCSVCYTDCIDKK